VWAVFAFGRVAHNETRWHYLVTAIFGVLSSTYKRTNLDTIGVL
jgi:hypothetical protein